MKTVLLSLAALAIGAPLALAQDTSTYNLNRASYEDRVGQELRQLRREVDMAARSAPLTAQARFGAVYDALDQADQAFASYKTSSELDLRARRQELDLSVNRVVSIWTDFRVSGPALEPTPDNGTGE